MYAHEIIAKLDNITITLNPNHQFLFDLDSNDNQNNLSFHNTENCIVLILYLFVKND